MAEQPSNTVLVVDDTEAGRYTICRILQKAGFTVWEAATGDEALRLAAEKPDLVILDINLPDINGFEVCRRIKADAETASVLVLHLSASMVESENRAAGLEGGADGYLTYPVEPRELLANIHALLRVRHAERLAREQRELMHVTLSSIGDAVIATDIAGRVTFMNPVAQSLTGWSPEEAAGKSLTEVFHIVDEQTQRPVENPLALVLREEPVSGPSSLMILVDRNGKKRPIDDSATAIRDSAGKMVGAVMVFRDASERRRSENEIARLLAAERRYAQQLGQVAAASLTINVAGRLENVLRVVTEEARQIIGTHQSLLSMTAGAGGSDVAPTLSISGKYASWQSPAPQPVHGSVVALVCQNNRPIRMTQAELQASPLETELQNQQPGSPPLRGLLAAPLTGRNGMNLGVIQLSDKFDNDFTEDDENILVQLAQVASVAVENTRLIGELRETDRLKDEFLAMLGHELRNPLAPILNAVHVLRIKGSDNPEIRWAVDVTNRQVQQLTRLVDDLLDVSRINQGKISLQKELLDLAVVVNRAVETSRPLIESRKHRFELVMPHEEAWVEADPLRLAQVLWNLLVNAAKYTPEGGQIRLTVEIEENQAVMRVLDSGVGISTEMLPKVFDLFAQVQRTLDRSEGGLGIGLTLVRRLTEMHGGSVAVHSEGLGKGSEFVIRIPLMARQRPIRKTPIESDKGILPIARNSRRFLVVDDNHDSANSLAMLLRLLGHDVRTAYDGPQAIDAAMESRPDITILDIGLPGLNGYEVARKMRSHPPLQQMVLIALTGYGSDDDRRISQEAGFDSHLIKPVNLTALKDLLDALAPGDQRPEL